MEHFPIYLATTATRIVLSGGGEAALAKLRLLLKTTAEIHVHTPVPAPEISRWAQAGRLTLHERPLAPGDVAGATLFYAADEDPVEDARTAALGRAEGALINVVDNLEESAFITPAIVDRDPVTIAIGTEGAAPVLARALKADLEARLPARLGLMARVSKTFRQMAEALPFGRARRDFWREYYFGAESAQTEEAARQTLGTLLNRHLAKSARPGHVAFVGAGPGDPELLTLKARKALDEADVVIHDRLISPEILELARREAVLIDVGKKGFGPATSQAHINTLLTEHGASGAQVVRLKAGDATVFGRLDEEIEALERAGIAWHIVPGITAASAAVATIGQSLTKRARNASVRLLTGHDMKGFADHDWATMAQPGEVAAIYMGKKSARFIQGRLIMHGADRATAVTVIENASRTDERILSTTLGQLPDDLAAADLSGPALMLYGLSSRRAAEAMAPQPQLQEAL